MPDLQRSTFSITEFQLNWIKLRSEDTGMQQSEIIRRALDTYIHVEEEKEHRSLFTGDQLREAREIAKQKGMTLKSWIRHLVNIQRDRFFGRY